MSNVVQFPRHKRQRCTRDCGSCAVDCMLDVLFVCETCGGAEASLPTHCPGARMDQMMESSVQRGTADFINGEWRWLGFTARECFDG